MVLVLDLPQVGDYNLFYTFSAEVKDLQLESLSFSLLKLGQANTRLLSCIIIDEGLLNF